MLGYRSVMAVGDDLPADLGPADDVVVTLEDAGQARALLRRATVRDCGYIGLIASDRDAVKALLALAKERVPKTRLDRVAAPAGVDIGAETPGEIAVSVAAELVATRRTDRGPPGPKAPSFGFGLGRTGVSRRTGRGKRR